MSELAVTGVWARTRGGWARAKLLGRALGEYFRLMVQAQRTWLIGVGLGISAAWLNVLPAVTVPPWLVAGIIVATLATAQFQAYHAVREEREAFVQARAADAIVNQIAAMRTTETELRNRVVRDKASYEEWKAELVELRAAIHKALGRLSPAEAETFHTIGNLKHVGQGGISDEHNLLLAVATRDLDHLAELIHGYTRYQD